MDHLTREREEIRQVLHAVNERISVGGLVDFSAAIALTMMRWCGVA